jgi:hypothetical protein
MAAFTTIAAGIGLATNIGASIGSFSLAAKQREKQKQAEIDAQEAMDAAKAKLEVNYMEGRSIQKEAYERAREAGLSGSKQILQAAREGEQRGAAVGAGRAAVFNQAAQAQARTDMAQDLQNFETAALEEESRLRDARANLDLGEVAGQQQIAADARAAEQAANMAAVGGLVNLGTQAMQLPSLYGKADPSSVMVDNKMVSRNLIDQEGPGMSRYLTGNSGSIIDTQTIFQDPFKPVVPGIYGNFTYPEVGSTSLSSQYDSVTGRLK